MTYIEQFYIFISVDMRNGIKYLLALRKFYIAIGKTDSAEEVKRKALVWKDKMDSDHKNGLSN